VYVPIEEGNRELILEEEETKNKEGSRYRTVEKRYLLFE